MTSTRPRLVGTHHHYLTNIVGPGTDVGEGIYGLVKNFINNEGSNLVLGDVVKINTAGNDYVEKTETLNDPLVVGVVAGAGPYANAASVPVLIMGYHPSIKITGAVARGAYLTASGTDGTAEAMSPGSIGAFARATRTGAAGVVAAIVFEPELGGATSIAFTSLTDVPANYSGAALKAVRVNAGATGLEFVNFPAGGSIEYDPRRAPASPSTYDDEFDDLSLAGAWTQANGGGATRSVDETLRKGLLYISNLDGGGGSDTGVYKAYTPGAVALTVVAHVFRNVKNAGSNQANLQLYDGAGAFIYGVGALQGYQFIVNDTGGFRTYNSIGYLQGDIGELWLMLQRDSGTGYSAYVSGDGEIWHRLEGATRTGTVGRLKIVNVSFSASMCEAWWDFVRTFTSQTFKIGGTP